MTDSNRLIVRAGGDIVVDSEFTLPILLNPNGSDQVIEAWTYNNGAKVFLKPVLELEKKPIIEKLIETKKKIKAVPKKQNLIIF